jgi:hypothetical protein
VGVTPVGRAAVRGCAGSWSCRGCRRWWCRRGSGRRSSPTGGWPAMVETENGAVADAGLAAVGLMGDGRTSQAAAGWSQPPGNRQCWSRWMTSRRIAAGMSLLTPTSSGRLGPASRAPSSPRRRNEASPPGPDTRATAWPMIACSSAARPRAAVSIRSASAVLAGDAAALTWLTSSGISTGWRVGARQVARCPRAPTRSLFDYLFYITSGHRHFGNTTPIPPQLRGPKMTGSREFAVGVDYEP